MKKIHFSFLTSLMVLCVVWSCTNSSESKRNSSDAKTNSPDSKTTSPDLNLTGRDGSFSYTINGERVETANNVQHATLFINEVSNDAANSMVKIQVTCGGSNVFDFNINNSGSTTINDYRPSLS